MYREDSTFRGHFPSFFPFHLFLSFASLPAPSLSLSLLSLDIILNVFNTNVNHANSLASRLLDIRNYNSVVLLGLSHLLPRSYSRPCHYSFQAFHSLTTVSCHPSFLPLFTVPHHLSVTIPSLLVLGTIVKHYHHPVAWTQYVPFSSHPSVPPP